MTGSSLNHHSSATWMLYCTRGLQTIE